MDSLKISQVSQHGTSHFKHHRPHDTQRSKDFVKALQLAVLRDDDAVPCLVILRSSGSTQHLHPWKCLWCWWSARIFILFIGSTKHIASHYAININIDIDIDTAACREFTESDTKAAKIMGFTCEPVRTSGMSMGDNSSHWPFCGLYT